MVTQPAAAPLRALADAWNQFWFRPADPTVLGLIRLLCGLIVLYVHVTYGFGLMNWVGPGGWLDARGLAEYRHELPSVAQPSEWRGPQPEPLSGVMEQRQDIVEYYNRWGVDPRQTTTRGVVGWSIWDGVTDPNWAAVLYGLCLAVIVLFTLGVATRFTAVLTWLVALSFMHRIPLANFGLDSTVSLALLYMAIGPSGAAVSADRLLSRWRRTKTSLTEPLEPTPSVGANFAVRLIQVHFCIIYLASGLTKLLGAPWWNGSAFWTILANNEMAAFHVPGYTGLLTWLAGHRWLLEVVLTVGVGYTLALEIGFPFLVWNPKLRNWMIVAAVLLHTGIALAMDHLVSFSLMMLVLLLSFVPAESLRRFLAWFGRGKTEYRLVYDSRVSSQVRTARLVRTFDIWDRVTVEDIAAEKSKPNAGKHRLRLTAGDQAWTGYAVFERLARSLRLLWPVGLVTWLPGASPLGRRWYP